MRVSVQVTDELRGRNVSVSGLDKGASLPSRLVFGGRACTIAATRAKGPQGTYRLYVSRSIGKAFGLNRNAIIHARVQGTTWYLGPILGLYVDRTASLDRPFGEQTRMFEELTTYGRSLGVHVVILTPGDLQAKCVNRYNTHAECWMVNENLIPDIVIRRSGSFTKSNAEQAKWELLQFQKSGRLHTLPRECSNKWTIHQILSNTTDLKDHLPRTTLCTSAGDLFDAVMARRDVYVKPPGGAQGVSIYHLKRMGKQVQASWERRIVPRQTERVSSVFKPETKLLYRNLSSQMDFQKFWKASRLKRAIVQDTVPLPKVNGAPYDFRWLVQASDSPTIIARVARVGQSGAVTTNIHTGGIAKSAEDLVERAVGCKRRDAMLETMDSIATGVVRTLKHKYGDFAELGIDLALTPAGEIYIFEINATPGRRMLRMVSPGARRLSLELLLEYAIRATGYSG
ncbi:YheC/YheD family protein [Alicyclobacillus dauci]|uniref:YheC/YheD family protein n=1 Tax=Alicyclobacillus dauci TaxID=1475485 RepID=A0ABY6YXJ9_9BACL|nr:YheC/YheD family protein [Alicyclobacillus dauci]WAH35333.1 YheC/YheD family protein [Alicyclobacillus dauci]